MSNTVSLRDVNYADLPIFFEQQRDPAANKMAAFTARDPNDLDAFQAHWQRVLGDGTIIKQTILFNGEVAGNIGFWVQDGEPEVGYWLGKQYWGKGIATRALAAFLGLIETRPLFARAAKDNIASLRVLTKCGFQIVGEGKAFANARGEEVEEYILRLGASEEGATR
jgi:RimJ/RimL family protein N-acetyltransferase